MNDIQTILSLRTKPSVWNGEVFEYAEFKLDGVRMTVIVQEDGAIHCIGRKERINLWPRLQRQGLIAMKIRDLPPGTVLDGELHATGGTSSDVTSLLVRGSGLTFTPWNISYYRGVNNRAMDYVWHRNMIEEIGFLPPRMLTRPQFEAMTSRKTYELDKTCEDLKIEGFVLKADPFYSWWKLKPIKTVDCIVTGWEEGTSRNAGRLGALVVSVVDKVIPNYGINHYVTHRLETHEIAKVGTGFSDRQRDEIKKEDCLGEVVEIAYDRVAAQGRLRFPRFVRFRSDKPPEECTGEEL